ncbi:tetratricopeptide repeat protein [Acetobacter pasteurianus]|uniref:tetratricopeptide repeat protein n=1 Tax=Acetobacter pasteurianus TaxID=438 RepID=UPI003D10BA32
MQAVCCQKQHCGMFEVGGDVATGKSVMGKYMCGMLSACLLLPMLPAVAGEHGLHTLPVPAVQEESLDGQQGASLFLPIGAEVALAAFWSGPDLLIVADRPVASLAHNFTGQGVFADTDVTVLENATILRIHAPSHPHIMLRKKLDGWLLEQLPQGDVTSVKSAPPAVMLPEAVLFPQKQSGHIISLPDLATGVRLLIAPSVMETGSRSPYRGIGYGVRGSAQGVVVAADSSQIKLDVTADKGVFLSALGLDALPAGQGIPETAPLEGGQDWFWLGLHSAPAAVLQKDWLAAKADAEKAPPSLRWPAQVAAARAAFAAGHPEDAWHLVKAMPQRSEPGGPPTGVLFLRACAALLSHDVNAAAPVLAQMEGAAPELEIWHALYLMWSGANSKDASVLLARHYEQILRYPQPLRDLLLPQVINYIARYGTDEAASILEPLPTDGVYDLARAHMQDREGNAEPARITLENLTAAADPEKAAYARADLVNFLLQHDQIDAGMAAESFQNLLDGKEGVGKAVPSARAYTNFLLSSALVQCGRAKQALTVLDGLSVSAQTPHDRLEALRRQALYVLAFNTLPSGKAVGGEDGALSAEQRVHILQTQLPLLEDNTSKAKLLRGYGALLLQIGQADAAVMAFKQAVVLTADPVARAEIQEQIVQAAFRAGNVNAAMVALEQSTMPSLPEDMAARRHYDEAHLALTKGDRAGALALLADDESDTGLELRGQLYEQGKQWADAVQVVGRLASHALPETGALTPQQQDLAMQLATDSAAAHDADTLLRLKAWLAGRTLGKEQDRQFDMLVKQTVHSSTER